MGGVHKRKFGDSKMRSDGVRGATMGIEGEEKGGEKDVKWLTLKRWDEVADNSKDKSRVPKKKKKKVRGLVGLDKKSEVSWVGMDSRQGSGNFEETEKNMLERKSRGAQRVMDPMKKYIWERGGLSKKGTTG